MSRLNWAQFDGAEFESLVHSILFFTETGVVLFGRPGADRGQDAITADRRHVYQAKYGVNLTLSEAIRRSKAELIRVRESKSIGNSNYEFWKDVSQWTLVANFEKNPDDLTRWNNEIVKEFEDIGITIDFWDATELENRLIKLQDVEEAYFGGVNRCFLSLWEARAVLKSGANGKYYFATSMIGREPLLQKVKQFADDANYRFFFVRGSTASGKSRFLYEAAATFAANGWRVFWGMPESMAMSDSWGKGITNTCEKALLVIDGPYDVALLHRVYEQLSVHGYRTWKALFSCCTDCQENFASYVKDRQDSICENLSMLTASEIDKMIKEFISKYSIRIPNLAEEELLRLTNGAPGMISLLLGDSADQGTPLCISERVLDFAQRRIVQALQTFDEQDRRCAQNVLRWVSAWRTVVVDDGRELENEVIDFLAKEIHGDAAYVRSLLARLADVGLIVEWGKNRKIFSAEPVLLRQEILSEWLLEREGDKYKETIEGKLFVKRLLKEKIPELEKLVDNLARLSVSYLDEDRGTSFLSPIFLELRREATKGDVLIQCAVFDWVKKVSVADPESALDILALILDNYRPDKVIQHQYWGRQTVSRSNVLSGAGMFLLDLSHMLLPNFLTVKLWKMIRRIYDEEERNAFEPNVGEKMSELLPRMFTSLQSSSALQQHAFKALADDCRDGAFTEFDGLIAQSLLASRRESTMACNRRIVFSHSYILPGSPQWELANSVRDLLFSVVENNTLSKGVERVWGVLSEAHYGWRSSEMLDATASKALLEHYDPIVMGDLKRTFAVLERRRGQISKRELAAARSLWVTALEYGKSDEEKKLATACEEEYEKYYNWRFPEFFSWNVDADRLKQQIDSVKRSFEVADSSKDILTFFDDAHEYLCAQDPEHPDADCGRGHDIALRCNELYQGHAGNPYGVFLENCWIEDPEDNAFKRSFARFAFLFYFRSFRMCHTGGEVVAEMRRLLAESVWREELLTACYQGLTPKSLGRLSQEEFDYFLSSEIKFCDSQKLAIIPCFLALCAEGVRRCAEDVFEAKKSDPKEIDKLWWRFAVNSYLVVLRSKDECKCVNPIGWLMQTFMKYNVNGAYLEAHELGYLAKDAGFQFSQREFADLLRGRIQIEKDGKPFERFQVMPFRFSVGLWVSGEFDLEAVKEICRISVEEKTYLASYELPKYLTELDKDGKATAAYVVARLGSGREFEEGSLELYSLGCLASQFQSDLHEPWISIVTPICQYMQDHDFSPDARNQIYSAFQRKMKSWSCGIGEVASIFTERVSEARRALKDCIGGLVLQDYRKWALRVAEWELRAEQERAEEDRHE